MPEQAECRAVVPETAEAIRAANPSNPMSSYQTRQQTAETNAVLMAKLVQAAIR